MFVRCSLFLALLLLGRVQCQTPAEPGECGVWLYVGVLHITVNNSSHSGTSVSSSEYQTLIEKFQSLENHVTNLVQLIGTCTFVQEFRDRLTNLEAVVEMNKEELKQKTDASFAAVQDTLGDLEAEQQKVGDGLQTLRSETAQLTLTVGRNITQIKEELSDGFATINTGNVEMRQLEIKMEIEELKNETRRPDCIIPSYPYIPISCSEINVNSPSGYYQLRAPNGAITTGYCFASSCSEKAEREPSSPPGYYQLRAPNGTITTEYCPMECKKCLAIKSTGGWRRVAYLNMTDPTHECPSDFRLFTEPRRCSPGNYSFYGCVSVTYPVHGIQYQRVCGRIIAIQKGATVAFNGGHTLINTSYVDGVSLTHGSPPNRHHIWTFASALAEEGHYSCPCSDTSRNFTGHVPPDFVGDDYFCDSGTRTYIFRGGTAYIHTYNPLWDGSGCGPTSSCCSFNSPPWFCKELPQPTTDDIELRACRSSYYDTSDTSIKQIELYIQ